MLQEIKLISKLLKKEDVRQEITFQGQQQEEHTRCTDYSTTLQYNNIIYTAKINNGQAVVLDVFEIQKFGRILHQTYLLNFSHLIATNGCILGMEQTIPYLIIVAQMGQLYCRNLITGESKIIKNLCLDNQRFVGVVKQLYINNYLQLFLLTEGSLIQEITVNMEQNQVEKQQHYCSINGGFKQSIGNLFQPQITDWKIGFRLNEKTILLYTFKTQFHILEQKNQSDFIARQLSLDEIIKTKCIDVFQQQNEVYVCYYNENTLKICQLRGNNLINYVQFSQLNWSCQNLRVTQNMGTIIIQKVNEIYTIHKSKLEQLITNGDLINFHEIYGQVILLYKTQITLLNQIQDDIIKNQHTLNNEVKKFKEIIQNQYRLNNVELILQNISFDFSINNSFTNFQSLIKFINIDLNPLSVLKLEQESDNLIEALLFEIEHIYVFVKSTIQKLNIDTLQIGTELGRQLTNLEFEINKLNKFKINNLKTLEQSRAKYQMMKELIFQIVQDYFNQYIEIFLGLAIIFQQQNAQPNIQYQKQYFHQILLLQCLLHDQDLEFKDIMKKEFEKFAPFISFDNLGNINDVAHSYLSCLINNLDNIALPLKYYLNEFKQINIENDKQQQIKKIEAAKNTENPKLVIKEYRLSQQNIQVATSAVNFISEQDENYQELKLKMAFILYKNKDQDEQKLIKKYLIKYAIKQQQFKLIFNLLNSDDELGDELQIMIENSSILKANLNMKTIEKVGQLLFNYVTNQCKSLENYDIILKYFSFLLKLEANAKAFTLLINYILNLEMLLFTINQKDITKVVNTQVDFLNLLLSQLSLLSNSDQTRYSQQIVCKLNDIEYGQLICPSTIEDKSQVQQVSKKKIRIINQQHIKSFQQYKQIQLYVCQKYSPQAQFQLIIEQLIYHKELQKLKQILSQDPNIIRNLVFCYYCQEDNRAQVIQEAKTLLSQTDLSITFASICAIQNMNYIQGKELYEQVQEKQYFVQQLIKMDKENLAIQIVNYNN